MLIQRPKSAANAPQSLPVAADPVEINPADAYEYKLWEGSAVAQERGFSLARPESQSPFSYHVEPELDAILENLLEAQVASAVAALATEASQNKFGIVAIYNSSLASSLTSMVPHNVAGAFEKVLKTIAKAQDGRAANVPVNVLEEVAAQLLEGCDSAQRLKLAQEWYKKSPQQEAAVLAMIHAGMHHHPEAAQAIYMACQTLHAPNGPVSIESAMTDIRVALALWLQVENGTKEQRDLLIVVLKFNNRDFGEAMECLHSNRYAQAADRLLAIIAAAQTGEPETEIVTFAKLRIPNAVSNCDNGNRQRLVLAWFRTEPDSKAALNALLKLKLSGKETASIVKALQQSVERTHDVKALGALVAVYIQMGDMKSAKSTLLQFARSASTTEQKAIARYMLQAIQSTGMVDSHFGELITHLADKLPSSVWQLSLLVLQAQKAFLEDRFADALRLSNQAIEIADDCESARAVRAYSNMATQQYAEALSDFELLDPSLPERDFDLGNCYAHLEEFDKAYAAFKRFEKHDPQQPALLRSLAMLLAKREEHAAALTYLDRYAAAAQTKAPEYLQMRFMLLEKLTESNRSLYQEQAIHTWLDLVTENGEFAKIDAFHIFEKCPTHVLNRCIEKLLQLYLDDPTLSRFEAAFFMVKRYAKQGDVSSEQLISYIRRLAPQRPADWRLQESQYLNDVLSIASTLNRLFYQYAQLTSDYPLFAEYAPLVMEMTKLRSQIMLDDSLTSGRRLQFMADLGHLCVYVGTYQTLFEFRTCLNFLQRIPEEVRFTYDAARALYWRATNTRVATQLIKVQSIVAETESNPAARYSTENLQHAVTLVYSISELLRANQLNESAHGISAELAEVSAQQKESMAAVLLGLFDPSLCRIGAGTPFNSQELKNISSMVLRAFVPNGPYDAELLYDLVLFMSQQYESSSWVYRNAAPSLALLMIALDHGKLPHYKKAWECVQDSFCVLDVTTTIIGMQTLIEAFLKSSKKHAAQILRYAYSINLYDCLFDPRLKLWNIEQIQSMKDVLKETSSGIANDNAWKEMAQICRELQK